MRDVEGQTPQRAETRWWTESYAAILSSASVASTMTPQPPSRTWRIGTAALFGLALVLQGLAVTGQSLIGDAPYHLLAGHQALRYGTNSLNLEHPPLVKLLIPNHALM